MLYDENTIDQKLLDFVKNVDFSLDYTEKDYDADKDGKKGEILINNIVIGYKNSKNTFKVSNLATNEAISNAINNDSGVTARVSKNLYKNIKSNYLSVSLTLDILKIYVNKIADDTSKDMLNLKIEIYVTLGVLAVENVATTVLLFFYLFRKHGESSKTKKTLFTLITIVGLIVIGISNGLLICNELNINSDKIEKIENLKKQCDTSVEGSDKFFQKIFDQQKYF
jgi:heme/copper-type cytochrome/quinol oxidase subunit 4